MRKLAKVPSEADNKSPTKLSTSALPSSFGTEVLPGNAQNVINDDDSKLQVIFDGVEAGIFLIDPQTHEIIDANPLALKLIGADREHVLGSVCHKFVCPADRGRCPFTDLKQKVDNSERVLLTGTGDPIPIIKTVRRVEIAGHPVLLESFFDISQRKQAERELAQERDLLRALLDNTPDFIYFKDRESRFIRSNMALAKSFGIANPTEMEGKSDFDFFTAEHAQPAYDDEQEVMRTGIPMVAKEEKETRPDGQMSWVSTTKVPLHDASGSIVGTIGISRDITERKQAEDELHRSRQMLQSILDNIPQRVFWKDRNLTYLGCNRVFAGDAGLQSPAEIVGRNDFELAWKDSAELYRADDQRVMEQESAKLNFDEPQVRRDGSLCWLRTNKLPLRDRRGRVVGIVGTYEDITAQKRTDEELHFKTTLLEAESEATLDGILVVDHEGHILQINQRLSKLFGFSDQLLERKNDKDLLDHVLTQVLDPTAFLERVEYLYAHESERTRDELRFIDGRVFDRYSTPLQDPKGKYYGRIWYFRDITERIQAEEKIRESNQLVSLLLDSVPEAVYGIDIHGRCTFCNPACLQLIGYEQADDLLGKDMHAVIHHSRQDGTPYPAKECHIYEAFQRGRGTHIDNEVLWRRDGISFPAEYWSRPIHRHGAVIGAVVTFIDITARKRTEEKTRLQTAALESAENSIAIADRKGTIIWINPALSRLTGYARNELVGQSMRVLKSGAQDANFYAVLWRTILSGKAWQGEIVNRRKDGTLYTDLTTITPVPDSEGQLTHFVTVKQDITARKEAQQALEERTAYLNTLFQISPFGIVVLTMEGRIQMSNSAFERLFGYTRQELHGASLDDSIVPSHLASEAKLLTNHCLNGPGAFLTTQRRRKDGTLLDVEVNGIPIIIEGQLRGILALYQDITERVRAEAELVRYAEDLEVSKSVQEEHAQELARLVEELAQERDLLGTLMDNIPDAVYYKDRDGKLLRNNLASARALGLSDPRQAVGKTDFDFFPEEDAREYARDEQEVIALGQPRIGQITKVRQAGGEYRSLLTSRVPIRDSHGRVTGLVGIARDITERLQAEETLRASEERYRELFENASDIVYTTGLDTRLTSLNNVGQQVLGYSESEAVQLDLKQLIAPKHWDLVAEGRARLLAGEPEITLEVEVATKDGRAIMLEVKPRTILKGGNPVGVQGIARDITGRDEAEMELRHAQKLESVGRLASGIAHEINTPIQFVGDNTRFLQDSFSSLQTLIGQYQELYHAAEGGSATPDLLEKVSHVEEESDCAYLMEEIPKALAQTLEGVSRVATIVRAMKEFAHPEGKEMVAADLNRALASTLTVARNELKYVADVETEFGDLPLVVCNIGDINQVFLNLLVNAAHAIGEKVEGTAEKGKIRVCTSLKENTVLVTISDSGCGIPEANRARVFDPFFTTKEVGRGTGQGLAIARSVVVDRHKGSLSFESEVGKGTTFSVRLPINPGDLPKEGNIE